MAHLRDWGDVGSFRCATTPNHASKGTNSVEKYDPESPPAVNSCPYFPSSITNVCLCEHLTGVSSPFLWLLWKGNVILTALSIWLYRPTVRAVVPCPLVLISQIDVTMSASTQDQKHLYPLHPPLHHRHFIRGLFLILELQKSNVKKDFERNHAS